MKNRQVLQPVNPVHLGEMLLQGFLKPAGKSQATFDLGAAIQKRTGGLG